MPQLNPKDLSKYSLALAAKERELLSQVREIAVKLVGLKQQAIADRLAEIAAKMKAIADTLASMGAHPDNSLPPPVEPTSPEPLPVEPVPTPLPAEPPPPTKPPAPTKPPTT